MLGRLVKAGVDVALLPARTVVRVTGLGGRTAADRMDAAASDVAGTVAGDDELRERATRKRSAADARETAARQRATARETAEQKRSATQKATELSVERAEDDADRDRREALRAKADALDEREAALTAADEADRLADAADRAKANRKS